MLSAPVPITLSSSSSSISSISSSRNNNNNNSVTDISDPFLDISQNLFAGLNFPEVPKNEIIIKQQQQQQKEQKQKEDDNYNNISMIELKSTKSEPKIQNVDITKQKVQPITTNSQAILTPQQFALLYKNDAENTPSVYPSLTELVPDARYFPELESSPTITSSSSSSIQNPILEEEEESNEQAPLITPTIKPIEQTNVHDEVMIQLLNENMRLQQQLQQLNNNSINTTNELQDLEALQRSMNFTLSNTSSQSTINHQPMSQLHQQQQLIQQQQLQQQSHLNQQQQQSASTQEQQHNLKYVCCGNCHQWLSAPRNATYVYCPGCEAVNNCALAPQTPAPATTNRPPARKLEAQPWYLQCFSRVLG